MFRFLICAASILASLVVQRDAAPSQPVEAVMQRAGDYVRAYGGATSFLVCEERYVQEVERGLRGVVRRRVLLSDFAIVKATGADAWLGFRDVLAVDGGKVSDREDRLAQLLVASGPSEDARRISNDSARYNIGSVYRNFNVPTTALFYFHVENQHRFRFTQQAVGRDGLREIAFQEVARPTLIRTPDNKEVDASGTIWVRPSDGTIVRTRLKMVIPRLDEAPDQTGQAQVDVTYRHVGSVDMWLPARMTEEYVVSRRRTWERTIGRAQYQNCRRFQTSGRVK